MTANSGGQRGRKPIDGFWVEWIRSKAVNEPKLTLEALEAMAQAEAEKLGRFDAPSARSIRRYREEIRKAPDSEQREYRHVYWPDTFERGDLPWEAAPYVLELMSGGAPIAIAPARPTVQEARWFWRVSQSAPHAPLGFRQGVAIGLYAVDSRAASVRDKRRREAERFLTVGWPTDSPGHVFRQLREWHHSIIVGDVGEDKEMQELLTYPPAWVVAQWESIERMIKESPTSVPARVRKLYGKPPREAIRRRYRMSEELPSASEGKSPEEDKRDGQ